MESVDLSRHPCKRQRNPDFRDTWFSCSLVVVALGLAVALWHLSSSPRQAAGNRHFHDAPDSTSTLAQRRIGELIRWRGRDGSERLLVANAGRDAVVAYDAATGEPLAIAGGGRFSDISDLALRGDKLFVTDRGRRRVQVLLLPGLRWRHMPAE